MNNLSSYFGLTDARMRASEKYLPVKFAFPPIKGLTEYISVWVRIRVLKSWV
jgi:hypothetical protein